METILEKVLAAIVSFAIGVIVWGVVNLVGAFVVMNLWNWLMPTIFGLQAVSYLQTWGIMILCSLLFNGRRL